MSKLDQSGCPTFSQISSEPFKSDGLVHGYSGVLQYLMWRKEAWLKQEGEGLSESDECGGSNKAKALSKQALQHFNSLISLDVPPSRSMDVFTAIHAQVRQWNLNRGHFKPPKKGHSESACIHHPVHKMREQPPYYGEIPLYS